LQNPACAFILQKWHLKPTCRRFSFFWRSSFYLIPFGQIKKNLGNFGLHLGKNVGLKCCGLKKCAEDEMNCGRFFCFFSFGGHFLWSCFRASMRKFGQTPFAPQNLPAPTPMLVALIERVFPDPRQSFSHSRMINSRNDSILVRFEYPDQSGLFGRNVPSLTRHEYYFLIDISPSLHGDLFTRAQQLIAKLIRQVSTFKCFINERNVSKIYKVKVRMSLHSCES